MRLTLRNKFAYPPHVRLELTFPSSLAGIAAVAASTGSDKSHRLTG
jgi:hypothetical protein